DENLATPSFWTRRGLLCGRSRMRFSIQGHPDREGRAAPRSVAGRPHLSAMQLNKSLDYRQPQAKTALAPLQGGVHLAKHLEQLRQALRGDAHARILNGQLRLP